MRLVTSDRIQASLIEIQTEWTLADVERANLILDMQEDTEILNMPPPPKKR